MIIVTNWDIFWAACVAGAGWVIGGAAAAFFVGLLRGVVKGVHLAWQDIKAKEELTLHTGRGPMDSETSRLTRWQTLNKRRETRRYDHRL